MNPIARRRQIFDLLHSMHISAHAAHSCFFLVMSVFPALVLLFALLRHTTLQPEDLLDFLSVLFPMRCCPISGHCCAALSKAAQGSLSPFPPLPPCGRQDGASMPCRKACALFTVPPAGATGYWDGSCAPVIRCCSLWFLC